MTGWYLPTGKFVECPLYKHFSMTTISELREYTNSFDALQEELDGIRKSCDWLYENGDHPEWHCYEIAENQMQWQLSKELYNNGCIRVGERSGTLHFEGTFSILKEREEDLACFAQSHGKKYELEPRKR